MASKVEQEVKNGEIEGMSQKDSESEREKNNENVCQGKKKEKEKAKTGKERRTLREIERV